jgi:hypothetical protein
MSTSIIIITPEFMKAEVEARYGTPSRRSWRRRADSSLAIEAKAHRRRHDEALRLATPARVS